MRNVVLNPAKYCGLQLWAGARIPESMEADKLSRAKLVCVYVHSQACVCVDTYITHIHTEEHFKWSGARTLAITEMTF